MGNSSEVKPFREGVFGENSSAAFVKSPLNPIRTSVLTKCRSNTEIRWYREVLRPMGRTYFFIWEEK